MLAAKSLEVFDESTLWTEIGRVVLPAVRPFFVEAYARGAVLAADDPEVRAQLRALQAQRTKELRLDVELIAQRAEEFIRSYTDAWWRTLSERLQLELRTAIADALATGGGGEQVALQIVDAFTQEQFGPAAVQRIAVTETTRLMGEGARSTYRAAGFRGWRRSTAMDSLVCQLCRDDAKLTHRIGAAFFPLHPNDRCWPVPVGRSVEPLDDRYLVDDE